MLPSNIFHNKEENYCSQINFKIVLKRCFLYLFFLFSFILNKCTYYKISEEEEFGFTRIRCFGLVFRFQKKSLEIDLRKQICSKYSCKKRILKKYCEKNVICLLIFL